MSQGLAEKVSRQIHADIRAGNFKPGDKLPSERMLEKSYNVSRITINRAMAMLNGQGVLERRRGIGSFVAKEFGRYQDDSITNSLVKFLSPGAKIKGEVYVTAGQESMCKILKEYEKDLIVKFYYSEDDYIAELKELESNGIFGAVIWHLPSREGDRILETLQKKSVRFILLDSYCDKPETDYVITDNYDGGRRMVEYLISQGHTKIAYVTKKLEHFTSLENRQLGFLQGLLRNGLPVTGDSLFEVDVTHDEGVQSVLDRILSLSDRPTAIFASNDILAFDIFDELTARGLKVPEDFSLVGFDDIDRSKHFKVPLTTIAQDFYDMGKMAAILLQEIPAVDNREYHNMVKIKPSLVIRDSVRSL